MHDAPRSGPTGEPAPPGEPTPGEPARRDEAVAGAEERRFGVRDRVMIVEEALEALEGLPTGPRETALDAVAALLDLYGEGWSRALARLDEIGPDAASHVARDELVGHLLMIHGLHPMDTRSRIRDALETLGSAVNADEVEVRLVGLEEDIARVRLEGNGRSRPDGFRELVERVLLASAPELERVEVEAPGGAGEGSGAVASDALIQIQMPDRARRKGSGKAKE